MKITWNGNETFIVSDKTKSVCFNPIVTLQEKEFDFVTYSDGEKLEEIKAKKHLALPGEFEISDILARGFASKKGKQVVFKIVFDDTSFVHFGALEETPDGKFFEKIGENIDVGIVCVNEKFPPKKVKDLIDRVEPRLVVVGGDPIYFAELKSLMNISLPEEPEHKVVKSQLPDENTDIIILPTS